MMGVRYLGVDLGTRRIGLALAEPEGGLVSPLKVLTAPGRIDQVARLLLDAARDYAAEEIVIGLPLNMDGSEGPQARLARSVAEAVRRLGGLMVHLHDERLTSHAADGRLAGRGLTRKRKKARQDAVAAQVMLESFVAARRSRTVPADGA